MSTSSSQSHDDVVDRAVQTLTSEPIPDGPSPMLVERTRQAIRRRAGGSAGLGSLWRWAAIVVIAASAAAFLALRGGGISKPVADGPRGAALVAVAGRVTLDGPAPLPQFLAPAGGPNCGHHHAPPKDESILVAPGGGLANVIVSVSAGLPEGKTYDRPAKPAVLDQRDCKYLPRVVPMQVGQALVAKNSDPFFHNVHTNSRRNKPVNVAQPQPDPVGLKLKSVETAETFKVTCDLHPWMIAWVAAFEHPYFGVTDDKGAFNIPPLPAGTYTLRAWHERLGTVEQQVQVGVDGKLPPVQLTFGAERLAEALADKIPTADAGAIKPDCCRY